MLYAILCYDSENVVSAWSKEKDDEVMKNLSAVQARMAQRGRLGPVARLRPTGTARTVRKGPTPLVLDGPFAETKEQLLGFYVVDCESPEEALEFVRELGQASASNGAYEIRPIQFFNPTLPASSTTADREI